MDDDTLVCTCNEVYRGDILKAIKEKGLKTVDEVLKDRNIEKAARILPPVSGFFFGSNQIDDYYWEDLEYTQKSLTDLLNNEKYKDSKHCNW